MFFISFYRIFKFAGQGFWRNFWLSVVTISIIVLAFMSINFLIILNFITDAAVKSVQGKIDISVYFNNEVVEEKILEVKNFLISLAQVKEVTYISQDEALKKFRLRHKNDISILQSLEELDKNPLSAALIIKAKSVSDYPEIMTILDNSKYGKELTLDKNFENHKIFISQIDVISKKVNTMGIAITAIFIAIAVLIVFNTIRVTIYTHREEIAIMKLVGANNVFVATPFVIEGIIYAICAGAISITIIYPILNFIQPYLANFFGEMEIDLLKYFNENALMIFGFEMAGVSILNVISSGIAIRRYLKV